MSQYLIDQIDATPNIDVWTHPQSIEAHGSEQLGGAHPPQQRHGQTSRPAGGRPLPLHRRRAPHAMVHAWYEATAPALSSPGPT